MIACAGHFGMSPAARARIAPAWGTSRQAEVRQASLMGDRLKKRPLQREHDGAKVATFLAS